MHRFLRGATRTLALPVCLATGVLSAIALAPLIGHAGVPAFQQDWLWPVHRAQCSGFMSFGFSPWNVSGNGGAQLYPQPWWPYLLAGPLCSAVGPHLALAGQLSFYFMLAGVSIAAMVSRWTHDRLAIVSAIAIYLGNPLLLNMLHAGHLHFFASYAIFPLLLAVLLDDRVRNNVLLIGVLAGLASAQQQFFAFAVLAIIAAALRNGAHWLIMRGAPSIVIGALFTMPQWCIPAVDTQAAALLVYRPLVAWERAQSAPLLEAARTLGYIGLYDQVDLSVFLRRVLWIYPLLAAVGVAACWRERPTWIWGSFLFAGLATVTGLDGPMSHMWQWAFIHIAAAGFLRELYNAAAVIVLAYSAAVSLAISWLSKKGYHLREVTCGALLIISAAICGQYATNFSYFIPSTATDTAISKIASAKGTGRYLTVPSILPMRISSNSRGGTSPFLIPIDAHSSALSDLATFPSTYFALRDANKIDANFLRREGVSHVLSVPGARTVVDLEPSLRSVFAPQTGATPDRYSVRSINGGERLTIEPFFGVAATIAQKYRGTAILRPLDLSKPLQLYNSFEGPDPRISWARTAFWKTLPLWAYSQPPGIFTVVRNKRFMGPPAYYIVGDASGHVSATDCLRTSRIDEHFVVLHCSEGPALHGKPPLVLSEVFLERRATDGFKATAKRSSFAPYLHVDEYSSWRLSATVNVPPGYALVLHDQFNSGWFCKQCGPHVKTDGFANAWVPSTPVRGNLTLVYQPAFIYFGALGLSFLLTALAGISVVRTPKFLRGDPLPGAPPMTK